MSDFLTIMRVSLIPALEKMVTEEEKHLNYLTNVERIDVSGFCKNSYNTLEHLRLRLEMYKQYLKENEAQNRTPS